jgi:hypothetical protein
MNYRVMFIIPVVALSGCATMSADQCATADWRSLGFSDGSSGETLVRAEKRADACTDHGYVMDRDAYGNGREAGLGLYCTAETAYSLGESGRSYNGVCASHEEESFLAAYQQGLDLHAFTAAVSTAETKLKAARSRHTSLDRELDKYSDGYRDENLTMDEHNNLVLGLWAERKYLENDAIPYWIYAERFLQEQLDEYKAKVAQADPAVANFKPRAFPGPEPHEGPTNADAREMFSEVLGALQK